MKKIEVWNLYVQKNPKFATSGSRITFTEVGIYQFFERTWELAHSEGVKNGQALEQMKPKDEKGKTDYYNDLFGGIFGGKK